jgi:copper chaperone NosL
MTRRAAVITALLAVASLLGCAPSSPSIAWDIDNCDFCRMTVSDQRFGAAAISSGGRTLHFDSIECLAAWTDAQPKPPRGVWIADAAMPGTLHPVAELRFQRTATEKSPMGKGFVAVTKAAGPTEWDGPTLSWDEVRAVVAKEGMSTITAHAGGH